MANIDYEKLFGDKTEIEQASTPTKPEKEISAFDQIFGTGEGKALAQEMDVTAPKELDIKAAEYEDYLGIGFDPRGDIDEERAQAQSNFTKAVSAIPRVGTKVVSEVAKIPGEIYGLGEWAATGFDPAQFEESINNTWIESIDEAYNKTNDELFPIYKRKVVEEGGLLRQIVSPEFWATEGADGVGFLLSMFAPGMAVKALGVGKAVAALPKAAKIIKPGTAMRMAKNIDDFTAAGINTLVESTVEAMEAADQTKNSLLRDRAESNIRSGMSQEDAIAEANEYIESEEARTLIGKAGAGTMSANMAILIGPNILDQKWLFNGFDKASRVAKKAKRTKLGKAITEIESSGKFLGDVTKYTGKELRKEMAKKTGIGIFKEGFFEEGLQYAGSKYYEDRALGITDENAVMGVLGTYADSLGDTDFQKSVFLGSLLGGVMGGVGGVNQKKLEDAMLFGSAAADPSKIGKAFGRVAKPETKGLVSLLQDNFVQRYKSINDLAKKDENGELVINEATGKPVVDISKVMRFGSDVINKQFNEELTQAASDVGIEDAFEMSKMVSDFNYMLPFIQQEGGMEILEAHINTLAQKDAEYLKETLGVEPKEVSQMRDQLLKEAKIFKVAYDTNVANHTTPNIAVSKEQIGLFEEFDKQLMDAKLSNDLEQNHNIQRKQDVTRKIKVLEAKDELTSVEEETLANLRKRQEGYTERLKQLRGRAKDLRNNKKINELWKSQVEKVNKVKETVKEVAKDKVGKSSSVQTTEEIISDARDSITEEEAAEVLQDAAYQESAEMWENEQRGEELPEPEEVMEGEELPESGEVVKGFAYRRYVNEDGSVNDAMFVSEKNDIVKLLEGDPDTRNTAMIIKTASSPSDLDKQFLTLARSGIEKHAKAGKMIRGYYDNKVKKDSAVHAQDRTVDNNKNEVDKEPLELVDREESTFFDDIDVDFGGLTNKDNEIVSSMDAGFTWKIVGNETILTVNPGTEPKWIYKIDGEPAITPEALEYINSSNGLQLDEDLRLEVAEQDLSSEKGYKANRKDLRVQVVASKNGKRLVLGLLPTTNRAGSDWMSGIREEVHAKVFNKDGTPNTEAFRGKVYDTGYSVNVQKYAPKFFVQKGERSGIKNIIESANKKVDDFVFGYVGYKSESGVSSNEYKVPNAATKTSSVNAESLQPGFIYMEVDKPDGTVGLVQIYTNKVKDMVEGPTKDQYERDITKLVDTINESGDPKKTFDETKKSLNALVSFDNKVTMTKEGEWVKVENYKYINPKVGYAWDEVPIEDQSAENIAYLMFDGLAQIDASLINTRGYMEKMSEAGILQADFTFRDIIDEDMTPSPYYNSAFIVEDPTKKKHVANSIESNEATSDNSETQTSLVANDIMSAMGESVENPDTQGESLSINEDLPDVPPSEEADESPVDEITPSVQQLSQFGLPDDFEMPRVEDEATEETWDEQKEVEWYKENIPEGVEIAITTKALFTNGGQPAWAVFRGAMIDIQKNAARGTLYHESFHVVWNLAMTEGQRSEVLKEARIKYPNKSEKDIEEALAEDFRMFVESNGKTTEVKGKIRQFFDRILKVLKTVFVSDEVMSRTESLFSDINNGKFKNVKINQATINKFAGQRYRIKDMTPREISRGVDISTRMLLSVVDQYRVDTPEYKDLSDLEIINAVTPVKLFGQVAGLMKGFATHYTGKADRGHLVTFFNSASRNIIKGKTVDGFLVVGDLGELVVHNLSNYGMRVDIKRATVSQVFDSTDPELIREPSEEETRMEGWQVNFTEQSGKDKLSSKIKRILREVPKLHKNGKPHIDEYGTVYENPNELYYYMLRNLSGINNSDTFYSKFADLAKERPSLRPLLQKIQSDEVLKTQFKVNTNLAYTQFLLVYQNADTGALLTAISNRKNISGMIAEELISSWYEHPYVNIEGVPKKELQRRVTSQFIAEINDTTKNALQRDKVDAALVNQWHKLMNQALNLRVKKDTLSKILSTKGTGQELLNYVNPILNSVKDGKNPFKESVLAFRLGQLFSKFEYDIKEDMSKNVENKSVYSYLTPNFLTNLIDDLKDPVERSKVLDRYLDNPYYAENNILQFLSENRNNQTIFDNLNYFLLDGFKPQGLDEGVKYTKLTARQHSEVLIGMFYNKGEDEGYFPMITISDKPNMTGFNWKKKTKEQVIDGLYQVVLQENYRIQNLVAQDEKLDANERIKNFDTRGNREGNGYKYHFIPTLTAKYGKRDLLKVDEVEIKQHITNWMETEYEKELKNLKKDGVYTEPTKGVKSSDVIKPTRTEHTIDSILSDWFYNTVFMNTQIIQLTSGDPSFYGNIEDFFKRNAQSYSPKIPMDVGASWNGYTPQETFRSLYVSDHEVKSEVREEIFQALGESVKRGEITEGKRYEIAAKYGYANNEEGTHAEYTFKTKIDGVEKEQTVRYESEDVNVADAQAYVTLERYKDIQIMLGRWDQKKEDTLNRLNEGKSNPDDFSVFNPLKPFYYGHHDLARGFISPVQNKNSEFVLIPGIAFNTKIGFKKPTPADRVDDFKSYKYPTLAKMFDTMQQKDIQSIQFESAVKAGLYGELPTDQALESGEPHKMFNKYYGLQQETPDHFIDDNALFGTQIRKLILVKLNLENEVQAKLFDDYNNLITADLEQSYNTVANIFNEGDETLQKMLLEEVIKRNLGEQFVAALDIDPATQKFILPLYHPLIGERAENLVNAIFKNNITKQRISGGSFIQVSGFGMSEDLKLNVDEKTGRVISMDVMLPWYSRKAFKPYLDENGMVDMKRVPKFLTEAIGYRIPTEGKYSMAPLRIVGFTPVEAGGAVILPAEITTTAGSDFDVDKMFIMLPAATTVFRKGQAIKHMRVIYNKAVRTGKAPAGIDFSYDRVSIILEEVQAGIELAREDQIVYNLFKYLESKGEFDGFTEAVKVKYNDKKTILENSKAARDNKKIDIIREILTSDFSFADFINPGSFQNIKDVAKKVVSLEKTGAGILENLILPNTNREVFIRNMVGKELVGIFANHNANHAVLQYGGVELVTPIRFNEGGVHQRTLLNGKNDDGTMNTTADIGKDLGSLLAAVVDNAKEPVSAFLNINTYTADVIATIVRVGYSLEMALLFASQPVVKEYVRRVQAGGQTRVAEQTNYDDMFKEYKNAVRGKLGTTLTQHSYTTEELAGFIEDWGNNNKDVKFFRHQLHILEEFQKIKKSANAVSDLVNALRADTVGSGPTIAHTEAFNRNRDKVKENQYLTGVTEVLDNSKVSMMDAFQKYGIDEPSKFIKDRFVWVTSPFMKAKTDIEDKLLVDRNLTVNQINFLNKQILTYSLSDVIKQIMPENEAGIPENKKEFIKRMNRRVNELKQDVRLDLKENKLLKHLNTTVQVRHTHLGDADWVPTTIGLSNLGLDTFDTDIMVRDWEALMDHKDEKVAKFAHDLVVYSLMNTGMAFGPNTISHLIPVSWYTQTAKGRMVNQKINEMVNDKQVHTDFVDQFARNFYYRPGFVKRIASDLSNIDDKSKQLNKFGNVIWAKVTFNEVVNKSLFDTKGKTKVVPDFITHYSKGRYTLLKKVNENSDSVTYKATNKLGIPNAVIEFDPSLAGSNKSSIFTGNNDHDNLTKAAQTKMIQSDAQKVETKAQVPPTELSVFGETVEDAEETKGHVSEVTELEISGIVFKHGTATFESFRDADGTVKARNVETGKVMPMTQERIKALEEALKKNNEKGCPQ